MIPEKFKERMKKMLGDDYPKFVRSLENENAVKGVRINTAKTSLECFFNSSDIKLTEIPYSSDGFILENSDGIGLSPEHHSGMIYVQDPGAMSAMSSVDIKAGWRVLDMCAAPGGKSGQASAKIGEGGFLYSNEFIPKRAKITVSNFERLGIKNAIVTSLDTSELPKLYSSFFDLVIADVPCSGEGMFRKSFEATDEWSEENISNCAKRQKDILNNAKGLIKAGGYLLYSTCTYSLEENEMTGDNFLSENKDFELIPVKKELYLHTKDGITFDGAKCKHLNLCRRFYPHISKGEGQFVALMQKKEGESNEKILFSDCAKEPSRDEISAVCRFFEENLVKLPDGKVKKVGENLVIISHGMPIPPRSVFSAGVLLGSVEKGKLFPSHQFFSCYGKLFKRQENLTRGDIRTQKYLHGEEIDSIDIKDSGWCSVLYEGAALGGGKMSNGKIKNHYPKGLRNKQ